MAKILYTARATVTGGRDGHGRSAGGEIDVDLRLPTEMGGSGGGTNPEQLFAVGYAACFESALLAVARRREVDVGVVTIDAAVSLLPTGEGGFTLQVDLGILLPDVTDRAVAEDLITRAHVVCPYSHATRGNIDVALTLDGQPLS